MATSSQMHSCLSFPPLAQQWEQKSPLLAEGSAAEERRADLGGGAIVDSSVFLSFCPSTEALSPEGVKMQGIRGGKSSLERQILSRSEGIRGGKLRAL